MTAPATGSCGNFMLTALKRAPSAGRPRRWGRQPEVLAMERSKDATAAAMAPMLNTSSASSLNSGGSSR